MTEKPRIVAGSGRSGTTWILDVLAEANGLRTIFEPLHQVSFSQAANYARRHLPADYEAAELKRFLETVFDGDFNSLWSDYRVRPDRLRPSWPALNEWERVKQYFGRWRKLYRQRQRFRPQLTRSGILVKFIRANLMLTWLKSNFDARIVLIVRHPGAVVESQLRLGGDWDPYARLDRYRNDPQLLANYGAALEYALRPGLTAAEALTAIWVIENKPAVEAAFKSDYAVVYYEHLQEFPDQEWPRIADRLALSNTPSQAALVRPSQQTDEQTTGRRFDTGLDTRWIERIGADALADVDRVLTETGVSFFEAENPRPTVAVGGQT